MNQDEINESEHQNPANWSSPFAFYHSSLDSRLRVPKPKPWMGWSLNMANPLAKALTLLFLLLLGLTVVLIVVFAVLP